MNEPWGSLLSPIDHASLNFIPALVLLEFPLQTSFLRRISKILISLPRLIFSNLLRENTSVFVRAEIHV